jgi:hypothetical protein
MEIKPFKNAICDRTCATSIRIFSKEEVRNLRRDGGRPSNAARQGEALNDLKLRGLRAQVVSVEEKALEKKTSRMDQ